MKKCFFKQLVCTALVLGASWGWGKTVALWPLDYDSLNGANNLRCMVDSRNNLSMGASVGCYFGNFGWMIPPNPDTSFHLFDWPSGGYSLWPNSYSGGNFISANSTLIRDAMTPDKDFTIEGWINIRNQPANNGWYILVNALGGSGNYGGWIWSMRRQTRSQGNLDYELFVHSSGEGDQVIGNKWYDSENLTEVTNNWMHIALTHDAVNDNGKTEWAMYTNGAYWGSAVHNSLGYQANIPSSFEIGGRNSNAANRFIGGLDMWRISDCVLKPDEFLCAGGVGSDVIDKSPTAYYWKLDRAESGNIDSDSQVGSAPLSGGFPSVTYEKDRRGTFSASEDMPFEGSVPNTTVKLPRSNTGSFRATEDSSQEMWCFKDIGEYLDITNAFTIEGWFKPLRHQFSDNRGVQYIFNTRKDAYGWALGLQQSASNVSPSQNQWRLQLYVQQVDDYILLGNANMSEDLTDWNDWKHVALVYDPTLEDGKGVWTTYLDGVKVGEKANYKVPTTNVNPITSFNICGRVNNVNNFSGLVDNIRVVRGALAPEQFLCEAENPVAVPNEDVLGFWPMDALRGVYQVSEDLSTVFTVNSIQAGYADTYKAMAVTDKPVITNPDATIKFSGSPTNLNGSVAFNTSANNGASKSYLLSYESGIFNVFKGSDGWTLEFYAKREQAVGAWELLVGCGDSVSFGGAQLNFNFTFRNSGFVLLNKICTDMYDFQFPGTTTNDLPVGTWKHVALVCRYDTVDSVRKCIHDLYLDGVLKSTLTSTTSASLPNLARTFIVGGRPSSDQSFKGEISSLRLSKRPLSPDEFLCATPVTKSEPWTLAYWPLDYQNGSLNVASKVHESTMFREVSGVTGSSDKARVRVPREDTSAEMQGDAKENIGSVVLDETGRLAMPSLGSYLNMTKDFTIEGWLKWQDSETTVTPQIIMGTYRPGYLRGWKLYIDKSGDKPSLRIMARHGYPYLNFLPDTVIVDDVSSWRGNWKHIALVYQTYTACGTWIVYVDGKEKGRVSNICSPKGDPIETDMFALGQIPTDAAFSTCAGGYDMWRITMGALVPDQFLFTKVEGCVIMFR